MTVTVTVMIKKNMAIENMKMKRFLLAGEQEQQQLQQQEPGQESLLVAQ